jgi:aspartate/methionine/tyrosine aminotransferase
MSATAVALPRSGIRDVMDAAWELEKQLVPPARLIKLEVGQPNFSPPVSVLESTAHALKNSPRLSQYIPNAGLPELREAVSQRHSRSLPSTQEPFTADNVVICHGAVGAVSTVLQAVVERGDEILLPDPGWVNYEMATKLLGGVPILYPLDVGRGWKPNPSVIQNLFTEKTKAIVLCSPSNPTGAVLSKIEMSAILKVANERGLLVISDEIYSQIYFARQKNDEEKNSPSVIECENVDHERTCIISGVSKAWAMTGFRVGWIVTKNKILAETCAKLLEASVSCGVPFAQHGALEALNSKDDLVTFMVDEYRERRDVAIQVLRENDMYEYTPDGAFYILIHVGCKDSVSFCKQFLREEHVAISPGSAFGTVAEEYVRVSLASTVEDIEEGVKRLCKFAKRRAVENQER